MSFMYLKSLRLSQENMDDSVLRCKPRSVAMTIVLSGSLKLLQVRAFGSMRYYLPHF